MAELWRRVGLIVNPAAGVSPIESLGAARSAINRLAPDQVVTGQEVLGAASLDGWPGQVKVFGSETGRGRDQTCTLARWIVQQTVDALIVVGGDGTLSDVAQVCLDSSLRLPILGIGAGSTNVGRLITCHAHRAAELEPAALECWSVDCLTASVNDVPLGLAFNDVVLGNTVVGTVNGKRVDLDAAQRVQGNIVSGKPRSIGGPRTRVARIGAGTKVVVGEGESIGTLIVGFAEPAFFGKAITGGICLASLRGLPAGCLVCDFPLAQAGVQAANLTSGAPMVSKFVSLADAHSIVAEAVSAGTALCADGNPLHLLQESDRVTVSVRSGAVTGVRSRKVLKYV